MIPPKIIESVDSAFQDKVLKDDPEYWFTYENKGVLRLDLFKGRLVFELLNIGYFLSTSEIEGVELVVPNVRSSGGCAVVLRTRDTSFNLPITTKSKGQFLDVFPMHKALKRRALLDAGNAR